MTTTHRLLVAAMATSAVLAISPGDAAAQVSAQETWQLAEVAGAALPVVTEENEDCRDELHSATLTLHTDGRWTLVTTEREVCGQNSEDDEDTEEGRYTVEGDVIRFTDEDGEPAQDDGDDSELEVDDLVQATRTADGLLVRVADDGTELRFRR